MVKFNIGKMEQLIYQVNIVLNSFFLRL